MASADTIIVDIPALEEAISSFTQCSNVIGDCVNELQVNASKIGAAVKSTASDTYQMKMQKLASNVSNSQSALQNRIKELTTLCEASKMADKAATAIAESVESNFML